jgi:DNA uptake protein ComE-like DNA-binding protein
MTIIFCLAPLISKFCRHQGDDTVNGIHLRPLRSLDSGVLLSIDKQSNQFQKPLEKEVMKKLIGKGSISLAVFGLILGLLVAPGIGESKEGETAKKSESKSSKEKTNAVPASKVDLNSASQEELEKVNGIGPATAKKIVAGRPHSSVDELSRAGVSASTIKKISPAVMVGAAPTAAAKPASAPAPMEPKASKASHAPAVPTPFQPPPSKGMVWVNLETKVFHREGDRWYGKTKSGKYMSESDALKAGYTEAKHGGKPKS